MGHRLMNAILLRFYVHENRRHRHLLLYEWLLQEAKRLGIHGGSAFRAIAGFGRHGVLHEEHFFELAGDVPVEIDFAVSADEANRLLDFLRAERISIFYVRVPIEFGTIEGGT
jgi:PII-like signaling protein